VPGWDGQEIEHIFHFKANAENFDESSARSIVEGFLKLSDADRKKLYVPLSRLNRALRENDHSDKALDLGIALESLVGDDQPLDLSYKVRQRGTFFLEGTPDEKRYTFERLRKLYDLRSTVAHGKSLDSAFTFNGRKTPTDQFLQECCIICGRLIRKFIKSGLVSKWDELLLGLSEN
jgi:Apea-like HEPN